MLLFAHYSACIWIFTMVAPSCAEVDDAHLCPSVPGTYAEGLALAISAMSGTDSWTRFVYGAPTGSRIAQFRKKAPLNGWEEIFNAFVAVFGFILLACLFGTVAHAMNNMNRRGQTRSAQLKERKRDMKEARVPLDLQRRVEATYEYAWMFGDWHGGFLTDNMLSLDLRRNLAYHVYGPALRAVPMFAKMAQVELKCLSQKIKCLCFSPGDLIIQAGEYAEEMFLVGSGHARPLDKHGDFIEGVLLQRGDFFGEICFLLPGTRRTASVVCTSFCRMMVLTMSVFQELGYENLLDTIREDCQERMDEFLREHPHSVLKRCKCGNIFLGDACFCRKCGLPRPNACVCGNILKDDALFCRKCGRTRAAATSKTSQPIKAKAC